MLLLSVGLREFVPDELLAMFDENELEVYWYLIACGYCYTVDMYMSIGVSKKIII